MYAFDYNLHVYAARKLLRFPRIFEAKKNYQPNNHIHIYTQPTTNNYTANHKPELVRRLYDRKIVNKALVMSKRARASETQHTIKNTHLTHMQANRQGKNAAV